MNLRSWSLILLPVSVLAVVGCAVDISRSRNGTPIDIDAYESLETGKSKLGETLSLLGAPDRIEWKSGDDYLWYLHHDSSRLGVRLQSPISVFGYRHTLADLETNAADTNTVALVFDENNVLSQKSIRLSNAYRALRNEEDVGWEYFLIPTYGYSVQHFGDAGEVDFDDLFDDGQSFGLHFGIMPVPFFVIFLGGNYQVYNANTFRSGADTVSVDDLELFQAEVGGRLQFPPSFFAKFWQLDELKTLFYSPDVRKHQGPFFFLKWSISGTYTPDVDVEVNGTDAGTYFDESYSLSSTLGGGFEYTHGPFGAYVELLYQVISPFEDGSVNGLDTDASDFSNVLLGGGLSFRF